MLKEMQLKEEVLNLLERLDYETLSASNTIATLLEGGLADVTNSKIFTKYENDYITKYMEYDFAKLGVNEFILSQLEEKNIVVDWTLQFVTNKLEVTVNKDIEVKKTVYIDLTEEELNTLQNLHYAVQAKRAIVVKIFDRHQLDADTKVLYSGAFQDYQNSLAKLERDYEREKDRLSKKFLPVGADSHSLNWGFDFLNNQFIVRILCDCGVNLFD